MKTIRISKLDKIAQEKTRAIWLKNHAVVAKKRGTGWEIVEVDELNDDITSYDGAKVIR